MEFVFMSNKIYILAVEMILNYRILNAFGLKLILITENNADVK